MRTHPFETMTDEELAAQAAREGSDGMAFAELVGRFQTPVWRTCYRLLGNEADAHDAAQEVFVRMFLHRDRFRGESKFSTWVQGIAINTCLTLRRGRGRRLRRERAVDAPEDHLPPSNAGSPSERQTETALDLQRMLESLSDDDRALLIMKYAEGHGYDELAAMFELSVSACKMRVSRARERLQQLYPEHVFGFHSDE